MSKAPVRFPEPIEAAIAGYARKDLVRRSAPSRVVLLDAPGRAPLVLKIAAGLAVEAERLRWLAGRLPVPEVVAFAADGEREYLVMTRLGGVDGTGAHEGMALDAFVRALGEALREIHAVPVMGCPFVLSTDDMLAIAEERVAAGGLQGSHFPPNYVGRSAEDLLRRLLDLRPVDASPVFTHGDPSLPNLLFEGGRVTGFIDVGLAAVSDPWRDLGIAARSITWNIGGRWVRPFLAAYGSEPDWPRLEWFRLLDEFVMTRPVQANLRRDLGAMAP